MVTAYSSILRRNQQIDGVIIRKTHYVARNIEGKERSHTNKPAEEPKKKIDSMCWKNQPKTKPKPMKEHAAMTAAKKTELRKTIQYSKSRRK